MINQEETGRLNIYAKCTANPITIIRNHIQNDTNLAAYGLIDNEGNISVEACNCIYDGNINSLFFGVFHQKVHHQQLTEKHLMNLFANLIN